MDRYTHVHVCGGSESELTPIVGKTLFWDPGWRIEGEGENKFSLLFKEGA